MQQFESDEILRGARRHAAAEPSLIMSRGSGRIDPDPGRLLLRVVVTGRTVLGRVEGALTTPNVAEFAERLQAFCVHGTRCVLDLRHCDRLDSAAVSALLEIQDDLARSGGELRLVVERNRAVGRTLGALDRQHRLALQSELSPARVS